MENWQQDIIKAQIQQELNIEKSMDNSDLSILIKSFQENLYSSYDKDMFEKSWSGDLQKKFPSGGWRTINGASVFINNGKVVAGLGGFNKEIDKFFEGKKGKEEKKEVDQKDRYKHVVAFKDNTYTTVNHSEPLTQKELNKIVGNKAGIESFTVTDMNKTPSKQEEKKDDSKYTPESKKETSKPQLSPDQKKGIDGIAKLTSQAKELSKKQIYNPKTFKINKDALKDMVDVSSQIDEKVLSKGTREKLDEIKEELDNFVNKDVYVQMSGGRKGKFLNSDKDFESDLEDKETLSDKIKFIVEEYDKEDEDEEGNTEIVGIDEYFPKIKDLLVDMVKEHSNKKATEILNYKLF